jgi:hypothetical protein
MKKDDISRNQLCEVSEKENILAELDKQLGWLKMIGYTDVDCYFKAFEGALFGGRRRKEKDI